MSFKKPGIFTKKTSKNLPCDKCEKTFKSLILLNKHKKEHKPNKCHFYNCTESFNLSENLRLHLAMHNKQLKQCPECRKSFKRFATLQGHLRTHFKSEYFSCDFCEENFLNQEILRIHVRTKHAIETKKEVQTQVTEKRVKDGQLKNVCQYCNKNFLKPSQLTRHLRIHTKEKPYKCQICDKSFSQKNSLDIHSLIHSTDEMPHPCPQCPLSFRQKCNLKIHIKRVHSSTSSDDLKYPCQQCSCIFKKLGTLNAHIGKVHTTSPARNEATEILDLISQISQVPKEPVVEEVKQQPVEHYPAQPVNGNIYIKLADRLENGVIIHRTVKQNIVNDKRWLQCSYCPKQFTRPSDLLRHLRVHTREKPYECPWQSVETEAEEATVLCKRKFATKSSLSVHMKTHENCKKLTCPICLETFTNTHSLQVHSKIHSVYDCAVCQKSYSKKEHICQKTEVQVINPAIHIEYDIKLLDNIKLLDPLEVTENGIIPALNKKQKIDDPSVVKRFGCNVCGTFFKKSSHLKQHMSNHAGIRAHKCNICQKSFTTKNALNTHLKVHEQKSYSCSVCSTLFSTGM